MSHYTKEMSNSSMCVGQIIDIMSKRVIHDNAIDRLERKISVVEKNLQEQVEELENGIKLIQEDTHNLKLLKNKLLFIEQLYLNKTSFETEIDSKVGRIEHNVDVLKRHLENVTKDIRYIKDQIRSFKFKPKSNTWRLLKFFTKNKSF